MDFELLVVLLFFAIGIISNVVQSAKKGVEKTPAEAEAPRPIRLPNGDLLLPSGEVVPTRAMGGAEHPADLAPGHALPRFAYDGSEASTSELAVSDTETLEEIPEFESVSMEPLRTSDWEALTQGRPEPVRATLEATSVDWTAEHDRFHAKYVDAPKAAPVAAHSTLASVRGVKALRQAVLAAEVLGPPRSLRPD